ncbi:MAG TPA: TonB-dependent receptor, partial [Steroidobacteraceae bacterium]|nr:TonB-dependent receptor [Steroidobacteraceae bacterium]
VPPGFTRTSVQSNYMNSRTFSDVSPRLGADFQVTDDVMAYVSYSQGFKSGGFDMRGNETAFPGTRNGYDSETADNYEVGVKSTLFDGRLILNGAIFYTPYEDVQVTTQQFQVVNGFPTNVTAVLNAGKQLNQGAELEAMWRPVDALSITLNVGYLDSEFEEFLTSCGAGCLRDISSLNKPINAPDWTAFLGGQYVWELANGAITTHLGYQYRAATKVANTAASITDQDSYDVVDLGIAYTTGSKAWRFALDCKNLLDEEYRVAGYDFGGPGVGPTGGFSQIGFYGPPRVVSLTATFHY